MESQWVDSGVFGDVCVPVWLEVHAHLLVYGDVGETGVAEDVLEFVEYRCQSVDDGSVKMDPGFITNDLQRNGSISWYGGQFSGASDKIIGDIRGLRYYCVADVGVDG